MQLVVILALQAIAVSHASSAPTLRGNAVLPQMHTDPSGPTAGGLKDEMTQTEKMDEIKKLSPNVKDIDQNIESVGKIAGAPTQPPYMKPEDAPMYYIKTYWHVLSVNLIGTLLSVITPVLVACLFGCCYKYYKEDPPPALALNPEQRVVESQKFDKAVWRYTLCDFMAAPRFLCFMACCCPAIRWADTMRLAGVTSFFTGIFLFAFLGSAAQATAGLTGLILLCILTMRRQQIRALFEIPSGTMFSIFADCFVYCLCPCCAIIQEARQLEDAYKIKHRVIERIPSLTLRAK